MLNEYRAQIKASLFDLKREADFLNIQFQTSNRLCR